MCGVSCQSPEGLPPLLAPVDANLFSLEMPRAARPSVVMILTKTWLCNAVGLISRKEGVTQRLEFEVHPEPKFN